nr:HK97-gp10 family putative phage morphogenesis protein [Pelosinus baikalensis]
MYDAKTQAKIRLAIRKSLRNIKRGAKRRVPVRTGELSSKITDTFDMKSASGSVSANTFYAHIPEFGSKYVKARPYMRPAFEDEKPSLIKGIKDAVKP